MRSVLLTGFAPMPGKPDSASWNLIASAQDLSSAEASVTALELPNSWEGCFDPLADALRTSWDAVICFGSAEGSSIAVERIALNDNDPRLKDASGRRPRSKEVVAGGEPGYWTGLAYRDLVLELSEAGLPAVSSHNGGGFLPNLVFYRLMDWIAKRRSPMIGGLIRVPERGLSAQDGRKLLRFVLDSALSVGDKGDLLGFDPNRLTRFSVSSKN